MYITDEYAAQHLHAQRATRFEAEAGRLARSLRRDRRSNRAAADTKPPVPRALTEPKGTGGDDVATVRAAAEDPVSLLDRRAS